MIIKKWPAKQKSREVEVVLVLNFEPSIHHPFFTVLILG